MFVMKFVGVSHFFFSICFACIVMKIVNRKKKGKPPNIFRRRRTGFTPRVRKRHLPVSAAFTLVGRIEVSMILKATLDRFTHTRQVSGEE